MPMLSGGKEVTVSKVNEDDLYQKTLNTSLKRRRTIDILRSELLLYFSENDNEEFTGIAKSIKLCTILSQKVLAEKDVEIIDPTVVKRKLKSLSLTSIKPDSTAWPKIIKNFGTTASNIDEHSSDSNPRRLEDIPDSIARLELDK